MLAHTALGLSIGVAAVLAWHFATPTVDPAVDPNGTYDGAYLSLSNATIVYPGVAWWPASILILVAMTVAIVAAGVVLSVAFAHGVVRAPRPRVGGVLAWFAALGAAAGLALAAVGSAVPPIRPFPYMREGRSADVAPQDAIERAVHLDLDPIWLTFPLGGLLIGAGLAAGFVVAGFGWSRTRR